MKKCLFIILLVSSLNSYAGITGKIVGKVVEAETGTALPGANVQLSGTMKGAATNLDGEFRIVNLQPGKYTLVTTYIGYKQNSMEITISPKQTLSIQVEMVFETLKGEEVVVTAQLEGQARAINQQIASNTIVNVVSPDKIQELPDQNAAESLGRLPGISVQRDAGEGQKVVVRGLSPKFNSITVNGERIPSTDEEDRSVDLSMISPDILAGIEVYKALTPDKDGDAVGGTINFTIRKAPENFHGDVRLQTGYNDHEEKFGLYKGSFSVSNRFLNNKIGVLFTGNTQRADRSSDLLDASYTFSKDKGDERGTVEVADLNLVDRLETRDRYGASIAVDYDLENGQILFSSFWGLTERDEIRRRKRYRVGEARVQYDMRDREINTSLYTNSLSGTHIYKSLEIEWRGSYSKTKQNMPFSHYAYFQEKAPFYNNIITDKGPTYIPEGAKNNLDETYFKRGFLDELYVKDKDWTAQLNVKYPFTFGPKISGYIKAGGKIRDKERIRDITQYMTDHLEFVDVVNIYNADPAGFYRDLVITDDDRIGIKSFIDPGFSTGDFLNGQYEFGPGLDVDQLNEFKDYYRSKYYLNTVIDLEDYTASEQIKAGYFMSEISFFDKIMILGGLRYEKTNNDYVSIWGTPVSTSGTTTIASASDTTGKRSYEEVLPMIHLRIKPLQWFDVRLAMTKSLSRPNYINLVPWRAVYQGENEMEQGNPNLMHTKSWNYDAFLSFYNRLGLFTIGGFYKKLTDIDYLYVHRVLDKTDPYYGYNLTEPVNSQSDTEVKGYELELQTNLKFLPSPLDGIVLYSNYSHIKSETFFPYFEIGPRSTEPPYQPTIIDTVRAGRMPGQADDILNFSIGYEKGGFSGRISFTYQGDIIQTIGERSELDGFIDSFSRWDLALQQKVNKQTSIFLNINNLTDEKEAAYLGIESFTTRAEYFGMTADLGIRYKF